jgi:hypothetical protein
VNSATFDFIEGATKNRDSRDNGNIGQIKKRQKQKTKKQNKTKIKTKNKNRNKSKYAAEYNIIQLLTQLKYAIQ